MVAYLLWLFVILRLLILLIGCEVVGFGCLARLVVLIVSVCIVEGGFGLVSVDVCLYLLFIVWVWCFLLCLFNSVVVLYFICWFDLLLVWLLVMWLLVGVVWWF